MTARRFAVAGRGTARKGRMDMLDDITFEVKVKPDPKELLAFFDKQHHEVTHSLEKLQRMVDNAFCCVTARRDGALIGFARGVTDGAPTHPTTTRKRSHGDARAIKNTSRIATASTVRGHTLPMIQSPTR